MTSSKVLRNPKSYAFSRSGRTSWYGYYACYSPEFVEDILGLLNLPKGAVILDPWNGSGTTTVIANQLGYSAIGFDINPVMIIVAKARAIHLPSNRNLLKEAAKILLSCNKMEVSNQAEEPLLNWLKPSSANTFRRLEMAIRGSTSKKSPLHGSFLNRMNPSRAFFYVALFRVFRKLVSRYSSSNPTWFKQVTSSCERILVSEAMICNGFLSEIQQMLALDECFDQSKASSLEPYMVSKASSRSLPLDSNSVDAIIASPPYCTRIDYAIATSPELAILGCSNADLRLLRESMIGSPTINSEATIIDSRWGRTCINFLKKVKSHPAKASASYYYKNHLQYFEGIYASLAEANRVLKNKGTCVLVVQDSYYKDVHNNLPQIIREMAITFGWDFSSSKGFTTRKTFAHINVETRKYSSIAKRQEQVLIFKKREKK